MNQAGYIARENIPISFIAWKKIKGVADADVVPEQEDGHGGLSVGILPQNGRSQRSEQLWSDVDDRRLF